MAVSFDCLSVLCVDTLSEEGIHSGMGNFEFEKSEVKLIRRKKTTRKRILVFKNTLSFASMIGSRWRINDANEGV